MRILLFALAIFSLFLGSCFLGSSLLFEEPNSSDIPNLVTNCCFETPDTHNPLHPAGWLLVSNATDKIEPVSLDSTVFLNGKYSLKIENNSHDMFLVSDAFKINFTGGFFIKASVKSAKPMDKSVKINFWTYNNNGIKKNSYSKSIKPKTDWRKGTISAGFLSNAATFGRVAIFIPKNTDNTIWIDDTGCYQVYQFTHE
jgi:hypothetical protein